MEFLEIILKGLGVIVPLLISVAYFTLLERKILAAIQRRRGPNVVGVLGLLQPFADGLKLFLKEIIVPSRSNKILFLLAPVLTLFLSLMAWAVIPIAENVISNLSLGLLYLLSISALGVYGIMLSGWASNSKYAFLGALRSAAQMISYEVSLGLIILMVVLLSQSLNVMEIIEAQEEVWYILPLFPFFVIFFISVVAETNRPPFDLPEAEAELVAGYNVEYASMGFAYFFIAEYANIILMAMMVVILFLGGHLPPFGIKILYLIPNWFWSSFKFMIILFCFVWFRASFPRFRFDQLMYLSWRIFLPLSLAGFFMVFTIVWALIGDPVMFVTDPLRAYHPVFDSGGFGKTRSPYTDMLY